MKRINSAEAAPAQSGQHTPLGRDGSPLKWLVVNPDGKLLAILDSESEAFHFTRNRGHANGAVFFKAALDYASAPDLLEALKNAVERLEASQPIIGSATWKVIKQSRAAIAQAKGRKP